MNRARIVLAALVVLAGCGTYRGFDPGHTATIACAADGQVHVSASNYSGGQYSLNGAPGVAFQSGFNLTLNGFSAQHIVVTAPDWPTFDATAGPCTQPSTSTTRPPCVDCVPNTQTGGSTTTTTTTSTTSTTRAPCPDCVPTQNSITPDTTTTTALGSTTTTAAPPVTTAAASSSTALPASVTLPPIPFGGLPATLGVGVTLWIGVAMLAVFVVVVLVMRRRR